jgi:hypothetical protein
MVLNHKRFYLVVFLLILICSVLLFLPPLYKETTIYQEDNISINLNEFREKFETPSILNLFRKTSSPFNFKFLKIYVSFIENKSRSNCSYLDMDKVMFHYNEKIIEIPQGEEKFVGYIKSDVYSIENMTVTYEINPLKKSNYNCNLVVDFIFKITIEMSWLDALGNSLIVFVFYSALFFGLLELKDRLKKK